MNLALPPEALASPESQEILARLTRLHPKRMDLSLGRLERLLDRLGHPERQLPPVVHIAGTNGKGSTIAYMRAALEAAGYRVHVYISPHLLRFNERIRLAGRQIGDGELHAVLQACERANGEEPITFFEITTAAAFLAFAQHPADIALLETGLGGRLDATNVVERPLVTAITPVSYDHQQFLGESLTEIAGEKAGILKPGVPAVIGPQEPEALAAIERRARALRVSLSLAGRDWTVHRTDGGLQFGGHGAAANLPLPRLAGLHQAENAGLALACLQQLDGFALPQSALAAGLQRADWPGRLQHLADGQLQTLLPAGSDVWLDGGHNPAAGDVLADSLRTWQGRDPRPLYLVFGMLNSKDPRAFLAPFADKAPQGLFTVPVPDEPASLSAAEAAAGAEAAGLAARPVADVPAALKAIADMHAGGPAPRVLICGSLYLAGHVLALDGTVPA